MNLTQQNGSQPTEETAVSKETTAAAADTDSVSETETEPHCSQNETIDSEAVPSDPDNTAEAAKTAETAADDASSQTDTADAPAADAPASEEPEVQPSKSKKKRIRWPWITLGCVLFVVIGYLTVTFIPSGPIANLRNLYIQTAMSTADHQWLATMIFPKSVIDRAWTDPTVKPSDEPDYTDFSDLLETAAPNDNPQHTPGGNTGNEQQGTSNPTPSNPQNDSPVHIAPAGTDVLGLESLKVGDKDYAGNKVVVADKEEGLFISEFTRKSTLIPGFKYHGYVMLIDDPSRVFIGSTPEKGVTGYRIQQMIDHYGDVVAGINASGFSDPNDEGTGGDIIGACISEGQSWGRFTDTMPSVVLTNEHKLVVGWLPNWSSYTNIRDGMQFGPLLVYKGQNRIDKASGGGMGVQPRTAIGQREDGAIIMIVIDGRVSTSIGCTLWEMADMMVSYGAVTAGGCDGGSSVIMSYEGQILNSNSSLNPKYGRRIPNAFLVRSKKESN